MKKSLIGIGNLDEGSKIFDAVKMTTGLKSVTLSKEQQPLTAEETILKHNFKAISPRQMEPKDDGIDYDSTVLEGLIRINYIQVLNEKIEEFKVTDFKQNRIERAGNSGQITEMLFCKLKCSPGILS